MGMCNLHKKKAVIIAGEWNSANLGDEIICKTFQFLFQKNLSDRYCILRLDISMRNRNIFGRIFHYLLFRINNKMARRYSQIIRSKAVSKETRILLTRYDVCHIIIPGGQMFQEYFVKSIKALMIECIKYNIPVSFNACGYGPNNKRSKAMFKWIIEQSCVNQITTRDSLSLLTERNIVLVPDVAIMAYRYYDFKNYNKDYRTIGINVIAPIYYIENSNDSITYENFNQQMTRIIKELNKEYKIVLFTNGDVSDQKALYKLTDELRDLDISYEERPVNGFELVKIIYKYSLVIGFRLHSLITAYSFDIPTIGIAWDKKLIYWGKMIESNNIYTLSEFPITNICDLSKELIEKGIDKNKKDELEHKIMEQIKTYL
jgi:polysaccharide pyruvyl transferase WcaK-like protein